MCFFWAKNRGAKPPGNFIKKTKRVYRGNNLQIAQPEIGAEAGREEDKDYMASPEGGRKKRGADKKGDYKASSHSKIELW